MGMGKGWVPLDGSQCWVFLEKSLSVHLHSGLLITTHPWADWVHHNDDTFVQGQRLEWFSFFSGVFFAAAKRDKKRENNFIRKIMNIIGEFFATHTKQ